MNIVNNIIAIKTPIAILEMRGASIVICLRVDISLLVFLVVFKVLDGLSNRFKSNGK